MADKRYGFMPVWHCIWESELFATSERFEYRSAWFWLLMHAYYKPRDIVVRNTVIKAQRGQYFTSIRHLASEWHWDKNTVKHFLDNTEKLGMTRTLSTQNGTLITILNYNKYNGSSSRQENDSDTTSDTTSDTGAYTTSDTTSPLVNKDNTDNTGTKKEKEASARRREGWVIEE